MRKPGSDAMEAVVQSLCERIDTPRSLSVWLCFKYNQEALLDLPLPDIASSTPERFFLDYFITEYLSKYKGLKTSWDLRSRALEKWRLSETRCLQTNLRFRRVSECQEFLPWHVGGLLFEAQRKIQAILGNLRPNVILSGCKWGPGATFDLRRGDATPDNKISGPVSVTAQAFPYLRRVIESDPHWAYCFLGVLPEGQFCLTKDCFSIVRGSRFLTVPKSAKIDRCIAAEPTGNSFLQQGVHSYIRGRLKRFGINLDDQSINQRRAHDAFLQRLSTLDLSAASDTISREIIYHLLPLDWALFLDSLRSPETLVDGEWIRTEKFASMGNAFCFELETLIFYALASVGSEFHGNVDSVTVYGDDIIIPRDSYDTVVELLSICGFEVNSKKSYRDGNFFESCGKHYHSLVDVTPVYQKEIVSSPSELIRAHNRLVRLMSRAPNNCLDKVVTKCLRVFTNLYPHRPFPRIPFGACEDGGFLRAREEFLLDLNHGYRCHVLDYVPKLLMAREHAMYAYKLRRPENQNSDPQGYAGNPTKGKWRTRVRWISEATVLSGLLEERSYRSAAVL